MLKYSKLLINQSVKELSPTYLRLNATSPIPISLVCGVSQGGANPCLERGHTSGLTTLVLELETQGEDIVPSVVGEDMEKATGSKPRTSSTTDSIVSKYCSKVNSTGTHNSVPSQF